MLVSGDRLPKLDFLRAASVGLVIAYHYGIDAIPAGLGVLTFFVISGFLITHLLLNENERTGTVSLTKFYKRRMLRIFPAFYTYWVLVVGAVLLVRPAKLLWGQAICSLLYVGNYYQGLHGYPSSLLSHTWSLGVEEQFYLVWPGVILLFRNKMNTLMRGLMVVIPAIWVIRIVAVYAGVPDPYIYTAFELRADSILVGCLLAIVLNLGAAEKLMQEVARARYIPLVLAGLVASAVGCCYWANCKNVVGFAVDPLMIGALILQLTTMKGGAWMDSKPIAYLGRISYSTYLYQQAALPILRPRLPHAVSLVGCFIGIWIIAAISYELVEKPFLRKKEQARSEAEHGLGMGMPAKVAV